MLPPGKNPSCPPHFCQHTEGSIGQEFVEGLQRKKGADKGELRHVTDNDENREICVRVLFDGTE
jgi:hypothetical protein